VQKTDIWMPLYIGDYLADTSRLTTEQHGAYLLLLMDYWRSGRLPDNDQILAQITKLSPDAWSNAKAMLMQFFSIEDGYWIHSRVEKEMLLAKENKDKNHNRAVQAAKARWEKQQNNATSNATSNAEELLKQCPSPSPSPSPSSSYINKEKSAPKVACPSDVDEQVWNDWLLLRKTKKASVTQTVINGARKEAEKAQLTLEDFLKIWCLRGSQGLEASWIKPEEKAGSKYQAPDKMKNLWADIDSYGKPPMLGGK